VIRRDVAQIDDNRADVLLEVFQPPRRDANVPRVLGNQPSQYELRASPRLYRSIHLSSMAEASANA
jgi:hypothetical protein